MSLGDQIKGKTNEIVGDLTNDQSQKAKGQMQQMAGDAKDKAEDAKNQAGGSVNDAIASMRGDDTDDEENRDTVEEKYDTRQP